MRLIAAFLLGFFCLFCTAFLRVEEEKDFTVYQGCCQSLVHVLYGDFQGYRSFLKLDWICHLYVALCQTVMKVLSLVHNTAKINFILRYLNLYVIILEMILKSMTSLEGKKSAMPLKMHRVWSLFIITFHTWKRNSGNKDSAFHVSQARLFPLCFRDFAKLHFFFAICT